MKNTVFTTIFVLISHWFGARAEDEYFDYYVKGKQLNRLLNFLNFNYRSEES